MSLYQLQKFLYELNRDPAVQNAFAPICRVLERYQLTEGGAGRHRGADLGLIYVLGANGQLLMHYAR